MIRTRRREKIALLSLLALAAILPASPVLAQASQAFQPVETMGNTVLELLTGTAAKTVATIGLAVVGILGFLTGRVNWGWLGAIALGCAFTFGGKQIINALSSMG
uniref:Type IV secretion protein VirB2 n=1 Tax=Ochrobactrum sp. LM19 TaxID=1449781 RepID=A0A0D5A1B8_9HYPH|nr:TrbC/VirB2 family protein [Ochrobactrum sp. LM19]AJW29998.1 type IV secretion protein VirB2 [Ochrobactrum sp. LM19]